MDCWRLDDERQTLVLASDGGLPWVVHWGAALPAGEDLSELARAGLLDLSGGMLDRLPPLSILPEARRGWAGEPGLAIESEDGRALFPLFRLGQVETLPGSLRFSCRDDALGLVYEARIETTGLGILVLSAAVEAEAPVRVRWLAAPVLPAPQLAGGIVDFAGRWTREFQPIRTPWSPGMRARETRTGRSGHEHPPFAFFPAAGATDTAGEVHALAYGWSGGHRMIAEELADGRRQIQFGSAVGAAITPVRRCATAPLYAAFSASGFNGVGIAFQRLVRDRLCPWPDPSRPRPVHYNCWEAVYFDHSLEGLTAIAEKAAGLGAERFVLDDGWFGRRDDDTTSLGDWFVDRRKWPDGLGPLIERVHALGMTFGLWVEPEMVNPNSELFRAHPDWALGPADQTLGRHQMVLDMGRPDVRDHLFGVLSALLDEYAVDYLKWDHNRVLPVVDAAQAEGTYDLIDRLRAAHPAVEIESCASGGGRIDFGILTRTCRVWLSDSNDAVERLRMQHEAALVLPAAVTGSHVGPRTCHSSGRVLPMSFRAWVAAQRHLGFEMDLGELTDAEASTLARVTAWWKDNRTWTMKADILRLPVDDPGVAAEIQVADDGSRFVLFVGRSATSVQILPRPVRLSGLDPDARYRLALANPEDAPRMSRGPLALKTGPVTLSGRALMTAGVNLPVAWPQTIWVVEGRRL